MLGSSHGTPNLNAPRSMPSLACSLRQASGSGGSSAEETVGEAGTLGSSGLGLLKVLAKNLGLQGVDLFPSFTKKQGPM